MQMLLRIIKKLGGDAAQAQHKINQWNRGSIWINMSEGQCTYFGIRPR